MSYKMMSPNSRIDWIPFAGLTTPSAPKATELNAGTNLSAAIVTGYTLGALASDVDNSKSIADEGNVDTPTLGNYDGKLQFFRDAVGTGTQQAPVPSTIFTTARALFLTAKVEGWLVSRHGAKQNVAYAAGDVVSAFHFVSDYMMTIDQEGGKPILSEVQFLPQGDMFLNVTAVA